MKKSDLNEIVKWITSSNERTESVKVSDLAPFLGEVAIEPFTIEFFELFAGREVNGYIIYPSDPSLVVGGAFDAFFNMRGIEYMFEYEDLPDYLIPFAHLQHDQAAVCIDVSSAPNEVVLFDYEYEYDEMSDALHVICQSIPEFVRSWRYKLEL